VCGITANLISLSSFNEVVEIGEDSYDTATM